MVRPRKEQIKNLQTRHSLLQYTVTLTGHPTLPTTTTFTNISIPEMNSAIISGVPDGAQEDLPAQIFSSFPEPYPISAGDAIFIRVDDGVNTPIVFDVTDTSVSKIANKINTALGDTVAFNNQGALVIESPTTGDTSSIVISDSVPGSLNRLGITAGTYLGADTSTRGVVTRSIDRKGGWVPLKTKDGKDIVTNCPFILYYSRFSDLTGAYLPYLPAGVPIHGRLTYTGTQYKLTYYAQVSSFPEVISTNSDFNSLSSGDDFYLAVSYIKNGVITISNINPIFAGSETRDEVIDIINAAFASKACGDNSFTPVTGPATIRGTISQPYSFDDETVVVEVDGDPPQSVILTQYDILAQDVVNKLNAAIIGITASVITSGNTKVIQIISDNTNGYISSINIYNQPATSTLLGNSTVEKLGITQGRYRGSFIAEPYGNSEIRIRGLIRGSRGTITVTGNSAVLQKLGMTAGTYTGLNKSEEPVNFPQLTSKAGITSDQIIALIPEVLEFGEVDPAVHSINEQFDSRVIGTTDLLQSYTDRWPYTNLLDKGTRGSCRPVVTNSLGVIDRSLLQPLLGELYNLFSQFTRGNLDPNNLQINSLVINTIETTGNYGNPVTPHDIFTLNIDPSVLGTPRFLLKLGSFETINAYNDKFTINTPEILFQLDDTFIVDIDPLSVSLSPYFSVKIQGNEIFRITPTGVIMDYSIDVISIDSTHPTFTISVNSGSLISTFSEDGIEIARGRVFNHLESPGIGDNGRAWIRVGVSSFILWDPSNHPNSIGIKGGALLGIGFYTGGTVNLALYLSTNYVPRIGDRFVIYVTNQNDTNASITWPSTFKFSGSDATLPNVDGTIIKYEFIYINTNATTNGTTGNYFCATRTDYT